MVTTEGFLFPGSPYRWGAHPLRVRGLFSAPAQTKPSGPPTQDWLCSLGDLVQNKHDRLLFPNCKEITVEHGAQCRPLEVRDSGQMNLPAYEASRVPTWTETQLGEALAMLSSSPRTLSSAVLLLFPGFWLHSPCPVYQCIFCLSNVLLLAPLSQAPFLSNSSIFILLDVP